MFPPGALKENETVHKGFFHNLIGCHYSCSNKPQTVDFPQCLLEEVHQDQTAFPVTVEEAHLPENV